MIIAFVLIAGAGYLMHLLLAAQSRSRSRPPTGGAGPVDTDHGSVLESSPWTALDDHQLNRLLDESSP